MIDVFADYLLTIENLEYRSRMEEVFNWIHSKFPSLEPRIAWNQPMFTDHGTYIIGFSVSKKHMAVAPESAGINHFSDLIAQAGYDYTKQLIRIPWDSALDYNLLEHMIKFNIEDKANCTTFWR